MHGEETGVVPGAVAIELIHNFSLIHDDIIDGDTERRHRSTCGASSASGAAIIAGDALATSGAAGRCSSEPTTERVRAARCLVEATQLMIAGQADDMAFESRPSVTVAECLDMERGKTSALLACAVSLGAILAGAPDATVAVRLAEFGSHLGTAFFQAVDDLLGMWGEPAVPGSRWAATSWQHKKTLPGLHRTGPLVTGTRPELLATVGDRPLADDDVEPGAVPDRRMRGTGRDGCLADDAPRPGPGRARPGGPWSPGPKSDLVAIARFVTERDR